MVFTFIDIFNKNIMDYTDIPIDMSLWATSETLYKITS